MAPDCVAVNVSPRFEPQIAVSQSARAGKIHFSFDRHFHPKVQVHILSVKSLSLTTEARLIVHE